jgi:hypothetical protein
MPTYRWKVGGWDQLGGSFIRIESEVTTSRKDPDLAMRKARVKHKKAPELSVTEIR